MADDGMDDGVVDGIERRIDEILALVSSFDGSGLTREELAEAVREAQQLVRAVEAFQAQLMERFEQDGAWAADGAPSGAAWLEARTASAWSARRARADRAARAQPGSAQP